MFEGSIKQHASHNFIRALFGLGNRYAIEEKPQKKGGENETAATPASHIMFTAGPHIFKKFYIILLPMDKCQSLESDEKRQTQHSKYEIKG